MHDLDFYPIWVKMQEEGKIQAIKLVRDTYKLPLLTSKCLVEIIEIIKGDLVCPHCRKSFDPADSKIPVTIQYHRDKQR